MFLPPCTHLPLGTIQIQLLPMGAHIPCKLQKSNDSAGCTMFIVRKEMTRNKCIKSDENKGHEEANQAGE